MKRVFIRLIISIVSLVGILTACSDKHPAGAVISGTVGGVPPSDSVLVVLFRHEGEVGRQFLTDTLQNGRFRFVIDTLPDGFGKYSIGLFGKNGEYFRTVLNLNTDLYLEPGAKVRIKGEGKALFYRRRLQQCKRPEASTAIPQENVPSRLGAFPGFIRRPVCRY